MTKTFNNYSAFTLCNLKTNYFKINKSVEILKSLTESSRESIKFNQFSNLTLLQDATKICGILNAHFIVMRMLIESIQCELKTRVL